MSLASLEFPQRKIKKSYRSVTGHFPSIKNNRSIAFESTLERPLFLSLEFDDTVQSYMEQPQITIQRNGKPKTYSADCYIKYTPSSNKKDSIVEAKYVSELHKEKEKLEPKFKSIQNAVKEMNMEFILFTDETFSKTYLDNLDFLYRYKTQAIADKYNSQILNSLQEPISAAELADSIAKNKIEYFQLANSIWALVANKKISTDLNKETLNMNSLIWRDNECN